MSLMIHAIDYTAVMEIAGKEGREASSFGFGHGQVSAMEGSFRLTVTGYA